MRSRSFAVASLIILTALLAACSPMPGGVAPTAPVLIETPLAVEPAATSVPANTSLLPTLEVQAVESAVVTPTLSAPITPTVAMTNTAAAAPAIVETAPITGTIPVTPTITEENPLGAAPSLAVSTYRDELGGFELDYPVSWSVIDVTPEIKQQSLLYSITFMSWKPEEPGQDGIPEGGSKLDVSLIKNAGATLEAAVEGRRQELFATDADARITFEEPWDLAGGMSAVHWIVQTSGGDTVYELITAINGHRVFATGLGDPAAFEQIAATLRPLSLLDPNAPLPQSSAERAAATPSAELNSEVVVPMVAASGESAQAPAANSDSTQAQAASSESAQAQAATVYTVRQGDTLRSIAARFGVTISAILKANPQITNPDRIYIGQRITIPSRGGTQPPPAATMPVNIYMIGIGGGSLGCGDQAVAVRRDVPKTAAPLTAALNLLLSQKSQYYGESGLYNALYQSNLSIASITRNGDNWTISLVGTLQLGGVCDNPRVKAQLEQTALQFPTVKSVRFLINGKPLDTVLSGK